MQACSLLSLTTAVPPYVIQQHEAKAIGRRAFRRKNLFDKLSSVFDNAAIAKRHLVAPHEWYEAPHGWAERNAVYLAASEAMFEDAAGRAIAAAGLVPDQIAKWVPGDFHALGADGFGFADTRPAARRYFHIDAPSVVVQEPAAARPATWGSATGRSAVIGGRSSPR